MKYFLTILAIGILAFIFLSNHSNKTIGSSLKIGEVSLNIEVADIDKERTQGLSGRESLGQNDGLLFVFEKEGYQSFWMKDMNFPIDMVWLDKNKRIVYMEEDVSPDTYPNSFTTTKQSLYVLETNSGFFRLHNIKIGDTAMF